jgi:hypothetical protein
MCLIVTTDPARIGCAAVHAFPSEEVHWSHGIPRASLHSGLTEPTSDHGNFP